jgi:hypothetical protein
MYQNTHPRHHGFEMEYGADVKYPGQKEWQPVSARLHRRLISHMGAHVKDMVEGGRRFYMDVGNHPEIAGAETDSIEHGVADEIGSDWQLTNAFEEELASGGIVDYALKRRVSDHHGHAWGHHGCLMTLAEKLDPALAETEHAEKYENLITYLITTPPLLGAGAMHLVDGEYRFGLSQKAPYVNFPIHKDTMRTKPIINTRNEPHMGHLDSKYRRQHIVMLDPIMNPQTMRNSRAWTRLAVEMSAEGLCIDPKIRFRPYDWVKVLHQVTFDPTCSKLLTLASGKTIRARDIQSEFAQRSYDLLARDAMNQELYDGIVRWERSVAKLYRDPLDLFDEVDWPMLYSLLEKKVDRNGSKRDIQGRVGWQHSDIRSIDLLWGDLGLNASGWPRGIANKLRLDMDRWGKYLPTAELMSTVPPGRPELRDAFVRQYHGSNNVALTWDRAIFYTETKRNRDDSRESSPSTICLSDPAKRYNLELEDRMRQDDLSSWASEQLRTFHR